MLLMRSIGISTPCLASTPVRKMTRSSVTTKCVKFQFRYWSPSQPAQTSASTPQSHRRTRSCAVPWSCEDQHEQDEQRDAGEDVLREVPPVRAQVERDLFALVEQPLRVRHAAMLAAPRSRAGSLRADVAREQRRLVARRRRRRDRGPWRSRKPRARSASGNRSTSVVVRRDRGARRAGGRARARARSRAPTTGTPRAATRRGSSPSSGVHDPQRWRWWSDHCTFFGTGQAVLAGEPPGARGDVDRGRDRCGAACARPAPRPPPALRRATSSAGTTRATGHRPAPPRRACADGCLEPARSP